VTKNKYAPLPATNLPTPEPYLPPQNIEAEQATLGSMLILASAIDAATALVTASDFYWSEHFAVFSAILDLTRQARPVDLLTMQAELSRRGLLERVGGIVFLTALFDTVPTALNVEHYARIVREKSVLRQALDAAQATQSAALAHDAESGAVLSAAQSRLAAIETRRGAAACEKLASAVLRLMEQAEANAEQGGRMMGLPTGFRDIDAMTGGLQPSDLVILAARPSMGKTALGLEIGLRAAIDRRETVAVFSLEMSMDQLTKRIICSRGEVPSQAFNAGRLTPAQFEQTNIAANEFYDAPLFICDDTRATPAFIARECRRLERTAPLSLIVVDYLQLMQADEKTENRTQAVGSISRGLKQLARDFGVPVLALSQLSRSVESRENKRPLLSDLRESGDIEQDADLVCFLYRESYYRRKGALGDAPPVAALEETELIFAKHRNGPTGHVKLGFAPGFARFDDWQEDGF